MTEAEKKERLMKLKLKDERLEKIEAFGDNLTLAVGIPATVMSAITLVRARQGNLTTTHSAMTLLLNGITAVSFVGTSIANRNSRKILMRRECIEQYGVDPKDYT